MSELISMRQRIKAVQTIKKITQAMRLIALSSHTRIKNKKGYMDAYTQELQELYKRVSLPERPLAEQSTTASKDLIILLGSQKGLCGTFNTFLLQFFYQEFHNINARNTDIILVGKKIIDYFDKKKFNIIASIPDLTLNQVSKITNIITQSLTNKPTPYRSIEIVYNVIRRGIIATPQRLSLSAHPKMTKVDVATSAKTEEYLWTQEQTFIAQQLQQRLLQAKIRNSLLDSLSAEQIARFTSMNRATKNATDLLDAMRINYNKLRQAKITRELTDLTASF